MIIFNQTSNAITSFTQATNADSSYPATNMLNEYTRSVFKSTATSTIIEFSFTGREFVILNCTATSGTIYAGKPSTASTSITSNTTISTDTYYEGTLIISGGSTTVDVTSDATLKIGGTLGKNESISFTLGNHKKKDIYFDMGSTGTWSVSLTLNITSGVVELGCIIGGEFTSYGTSVSATRGQKQFKYYSTSANYEALRELIKNDDSFIVIPERTIAENDVFIAYGKITPNNVTFTENKRNTSSYLIENTQIRVT